MSEPTRLKYFTVDRLIKRKEEISRSQSTNFLLMALKRRRILELYLPCRELKTSISDWIKAPFNIRYSRKSM